MHEQDCLYLRLPVSPSSAGQSGLIPRGPTSMETPPYIRKKRSNTMPGNVKLRHPPASSPQIMPDINEHLMSLEDFLAESDRTPNRVSHNSYPSTQKHLNKGHLGDIESVQRRPLFTDAV